MAGGGWAKEDTADGLIKCRRDELDKLRIESKTGIRGLI